MLALAFAFFALGAFLLVFTGATLGALHAFAAFIVLAIAAALNQLLPVLTHAPVARPQAVLAVAVAFAAGFGLLIAGFYGAPTFFAASIVLGASALTWVLWNAARLFVGSKEVQTRAVMACAVVAFAVVAGIGASMAGALAGREPAAILNMAPLHAAMAILGFASLLIAGISYRFVPMFAVAHGTSYGKRYVQWLAVAGAVTVAAFLHAQPALRIGLSMLLLASIAIGRSHSISLALRVRKRIDVSLWYAGVAWVLGIFALGLALAATWSSELWTPAIIVAVLGWICMTILGYGYKIAGFLAWETARTREPAEALPVLSGAVSLPLAYAALALLALGTLLSAFCAIADPQYAQLGYDVYAAGALTAIAALVKLTSLYIFKGAVNGSPTRPVG